MENQELIRQDSPEQFISLLRQLDGWNIKPSRYFPEGVEIDKTRKRNEPISIHYLPNEGRFRKIAQEALYSPKVEREYRFWNMALEHFDIDEQVHKGEIRVLKQDPSRGYQSLTYIDMPYMGIPLHYSESLVPHAIPEESRKIFLDKMKTLVIEKRIFHPDMNSGNILIRVKNGVPVLFPIDWESSNPKVPENKISYYADEQVKRCTETLKEFYE